MKSTGIIRRIDELGRIVIPREIRRSLRVREGDSLELGVEGDNIVLKKYSPLSIDNNSRAAEIALRKEDISFGIYDTSCCFASNNRDILMSSTPDSWFDYWHEFSYEDKTVFPIVANGERFGFVAVSGKDDNEYVRAVVAMMAADIFEE